MGLKMRGTTCNLRKHRVVSHPTGCRTALPVPTSVQQLLGALQLRLVVQSTGQKEKQNPQLLNDMIKETGSKASDSPGPAERRMGISHRYTQTRCCKPSSGKPRELQTCQVSTSEPVFLSEILPNTPLSLRAKPKPCFVSLPCITVDSRWVFFAHGSRVKKQTVLLGKLPHQDTP